MTRSGRPLLGVVAVLAISSAAAATPPPQAAALFAECNTAFKARRLAEARACFRKVYAIYPSVIVLYNLAQTEEALENLPAAYEAYQACAMDLSGTLTPDIHGAVRLSLDKLKKRLGFLRIRVATPGATLFIDDRKRSLGTRTMPVTPGAHRVRVEAPGRVTWRQRLTVSAGELRLLAVQLKVPAPPRRPAAVPGPAVPPTPPAPAAPTDDIGGWGTGHKVGLALGVVGAASLVAGTVTGLLAMSTNDDALSHCDPVDTTQCDATGVSLTEDARTLAAASTATFIVGGVALASGAVLFLLTPRARGRVSILPDVGPRSAGLVVGGAW